MTWQVLFASDTGVPGVSQAYHPPSAFFLRYRLTFAKLYNFFKVPPGTPDPKRPDILKDANAKTMLAPFLAKKLYVDCVVYAHVA